MQSVLTVLTDGTRYESGVAPVVLDDGAHTAEVQRVVLADDETQFEVVDSFIWEFRLG